ncbi:hypothetical protein KKA27_03455 [Patescibacteria group bacterium]|nr:hypothetical protein [Patescibacteria group bacterium]
MSLLLVNNNLNQADRNYDGSVIITDFVQEEQRNLEHFAVDVLAILRRLDSQGLLPAI